MAGPMSQRMTNHPSPAGGYAKTNSVALTSQDPTGLFLTSIGGAATTGAVAETACSLPTSEVMIGLRGRLGGGSVLVLLDDEEGSPSEETSRFFYNAGH
jgi:hypothetical protein